MKTVIVSDLHVDITGQIELEYMEGNLLIVAGDTSNSSKASARTINELSKGFDQVVCVDGNHEHYSNQHHNEKIRTIENNLDYFESMLYPNVTLLRKDKIVGAGEYNIIGCNGWYSMDYLGFTGGENIHFWRQYMNDVRIWDKGDTRQPLPHKLAKTHSDSIRERIDSLLPHEKVIVVTHTVPHDKGLVHKPWYRDWETDRKSVV